MAFRFTVNPQEYKVLVERYHKLKDTKPNLSNAEQKEEQDQRNVEQAPPQNYPHKNPSNNLNKLDNFQAVFKVLNSNQECYIESLKLSLFRAYLVCEVLRTLSFVSNGYNYGSYKYRRAWNLAEIVISSTSLLYTHYTSRCEQWRMHNMKIVRNSRLQ